MGSRRLLALAVPLVVLAAAAGCTRKHHQATPVPVAPTIPDVTTTTVLDFSGVQLAAVPGRTTTTIAIGGGRATVTGIVTAPEGPVPGAVVHLERLVGDAVASMDVVTDGTGRYAAAGVLGGRYRVRAFAPHPVDLAQTQPALIFVAATESKVQDLQVNHFTGTTVVGVIAPSPPPVGDPANLVVQVTTQQVDPKGIVRGAPIVGASVLLAGSANWTVNGPNSELTDGSGRVTFQVVCNAEGSQPLQAVVGGAQTFPLDIAGCALPPPTTTTTLPPPTTAPPPTTSTTAKPPASTTTTARRPTTSTTAKKG